MVPHATPFDFESSLATSICYITTTLSHNIPRAIYGDAKEAFKIKRRSM
jgi:hypothetical protein